MPTMHHRDSLRRLALRAGALTVAVALALPATAAAEPVKVRVTATVTDTFSLTIRTHGSYDFGTRKAGKRYASARVPILKVASNRPWLMTDSSDTTVTSVPGVEMPRAAVLRHVTAPRFNRVMRPGVYEITARYWLDLTDRSLLSIPAGSVIAADMGYTVVQQ